MLEPKNKTFICFTRNDLFLLKPGCSDLSSRVHVTYSSSEKVIRHDLKESKGWLCLVIWCIAIKQLGEGRLVLQHKFCQRERYKGIDKMEVRRSSLPLSRQ